MKICTCCKNREEDNSVFCSKCGCCDFIEQDENYNDTVVLTADSNPYNISPDIAQGEAKAEKKPKKKRWIILIIILAAVAVHVIGFLILRHYAIEILEDIIIYTNDKGMPIL